MKYLDTGTRDPSQTLARWFEEVVQEGVAELRLQTGFFSFDGIGLLVPSLEQCRQQDHLTRILIGSNDANTLRDDVAELVGALGIPRGGAQLGIVSFTGAYFHPKTYHIQHIDGSQAAFVGSANLTASGLALHVEAGIALDTRCEDDPHHLSQIAAAIDGWFAEQRAGMTLVNGLQTLDDLVENGVLALAPQPRAASQGATGRMAVRPRLQRLIVLPPGRRRLSKTVPQAVITPAVAQPAPPVASTNLPSAPRNGFPQYLLFEPNATGPTSGIGALSGASLPAGAVGLIIKLNKDCERRFTGGVGTANISIPIAAVSPIRFGVYGKHKRPRSEYSLKLRYIAKNAITNGGVANTNIMGYGYTPSESGHQNIRMLVPAATASLGRLITSSGKALPRDGDLALLEWPTSQDSSFLISFLEVGSVTYQQAEAVFNTAVATEQLVGGDACWMKAGLSPNWQS